MLKKDVWVFGLKVNDINEVSLNSLYKINSNNKKYIIYTI